MFGAQLAVKSDRTLQQHSALGRDRAIVGECVRLSEQRQRANSSLQTL